MSKNQLPKYNNPNSGNNTVAGVLVQQKTEMFSGPLPHPQILEQFNQIIPGAAERIFIMAENQSRHRIELEKQVIAFDIKNSKNGQLYGFVIAVIALSVATYLTINGHDAVGGVIGGATLVGLVSVFVIGKHKRHSERERKDSEIKSAQK